MPQVQGILCGKLGQFEPSYQEIPIQRNNLRGQTFANTLQVVCRETFQIDGSQLNKSVVKATRGGAVLPWAGSIIALKKKGLGIDPLHYMDIDMQDYRDVVDYLFSCANVSVQHRITKCRGVKIHCIGDQRTFGTGVYSAVDVPKDHPIFYGPIAQISQLVGMPIHTRKYPPDKLWKDSKIVPTFQNVPATSLHLVADPIMDAWGRAPMSWQNDVGSVLVVRSDGQDVTTKQVEALSRFCQFKMQPLFENALGGGLVEMSREEVMRYLTPSVFEEYMGKMEEFM